MNVPHGNKLNADRLHLLNPTMLNYNVQMAKYSADSSVHMLVLSWTVVLM